MKAAAAVPEVELEVVAVGGSGCGSDAGPQGTGIATLGGSGTEADSIGDTGSRAGGRGSSADGGVGGVTGFVSAMANSGGESADGSARDCEAVGEGREGSSVADMQKREERHKSILPSLFQSSSASQHCFLAFLVLFASGEETEGEKGAGV